MASDPGSRPVPLRVTLEDGRRALDAALDALICAGDLPDLDLLEPSRCRGWSRLEVLVHVRTGLEEMLGGCVSPTGATPDHDAASYWREGPGSQDGDDDTVAAILWTRRTASAYRRPRGAWEHLVATTGAVRSATALMGDRPVDLQGQVLAAGDFLATWAVELAVHHLDLDVAGPPPPPAALRLARATVEALLGTPLDEAIADVDAVLLGSGRRRPTPQERHLLGPLADAVPVL